MEYCLQPWVSWNFLQNNNHQAVKKMEWIENTKKYRQKTVGISFMCGCKSVSVCGWVRMRVCMRVYIYIYIYIYDRRKRERMSHTIITFQTEFEIVLFFDSYNFNAIALTKILLVRAILATVSHLQKTN